MELSLLEIIHILRQHILYFWNFMTQYIRKIAEKKAGYSYRDKSMTTNYTAITCQLKADMKKVYVDLININLY